MPMIKRITFGATAPAPRAPGPAPVRVTVCSPLPEFGACPYEGIVTEWFAEYPDPRYPDPRPDPVTPDPVTTVIAEEAVLRGADWLEERWRLGGERFKHMALAVRASGLTREEFSRRWRAHAGTAGGRRIPGSARGRAYAQNHCLRGPYDAVNEVWFDDPGGLSTRVEWFAENPGIQGDLFGESRFLSVRETIWDFAEDVYRG